MNLKPALLFPMTLTAGLCCAAVQAQEVDNRPNVYAGGLQYIFDDERNLDNDLGFYGGAEAPFTQRFSGSLEYWHVNTDHSFNTNDYKLRHYRMGGNWHLNQSGNWQPYLTAGLGYLDIEADIPAPETSEGTVDVGIGVKHFFNDNWMARGDLRAIRGNDVQNLDFAVGLSLGYVFGGRQAAAPAPEPTPVAADSDGDGVFDDRDACPNTPPGVSVDSRGCELDSDRDGVADSRDQCPDTSIELAVDDNGCPILDTTQRTQEIEVNFPFDSARIPPAYEDEIGEFADFMREYANTEVVIEGHTDSTGSEQYNQGLSERRANAVMNFLVDEENIDAGRLSAVGYGESRPVADNATAAGRERNRRIEAEVSVEVEEERRR